MASQLRVDKILPVDGAPTDGGGGIVQVVYAEDNNAESLGAFTNNGADSPVNIMSASITPKFSTSKILVMCKGTVGINENNNNFVIKKNKKFKVIPKNMVKHLNKKILKLDNLNIESKFIDGLRVTDEITIKVVEEALLELNSEIINNLPLKTKKK